MTRKVINFLQKCSFNNGKNSAFLVIESSYRETYTKDASALMLLPSWKISYVNICKYFSQTFLRLVVYIPRHSNECSWNVLGNLQLLNRSLFVAGDVNKPIFLSKFARILYFGLETSKFSIKPFNRLLDLIFSSLVTL